MLLFFCVAGVMSVCMSVHGACRGLGGDWILWTWIYRWLCLLCKGKRGLCREQHAPSTTELFLLPSSYIFKGIDLEQMSVSIFHSRIQGGGDRDRVGGSEG